MLVHQFTAGVTGVTVLLRELAPLLEEVDPSLRGEVVGFDSFAGPWSLPAAIGDGADVAAVVGVNLHIEVGWERTVELVEHCRSRRVPFFVYIHDHWPHHRTNVSVLRDRFGASLLASSAVVAEQLAADGFGATEVTVGVALRHVHDAPTSDVEVHGEPTIGSGGRLVPRKRFGDVAAAYLALRRARDVSLRLRVLPSLIYGAEADERALGSLRAQLVAASSSPTQGDVLVERRATATASYEGLAAFVSASDYEGFGMMPIEAAWVGCPPLLSDIPAHRAIAETLFPGRAEDVLFPVGDHEALAGLLDDELGAGRRRAHLRDDRAAVRRRIESRWSLRRTASDLARVVSCGGA